MYPWLQHRIDQETICIRFRVNDPHFAGAKPLDSDYLTAFSWYELIWRFEGLSHLACIDLALNHPLSGVMSICDTHRSTSLSRLNLR